METVSYTHLDVYKRQTYRNTVDILDEMTICQVKRYAMVKILPDEDALIKKTEELNGIK